MTACIVRHLPETAPDTRLDAACAAGSCVVLASARTAELPLARRPLMLATATFGRMHYHFDCRTVAVDDDNFLILNPGQPHRASIHQASPVECVQIYFSPDLIQDVLHSSTLPAQPLLENASMEVEFPQTLTRHERLVSPVLRYIRQHVLTGVDSAAWLEEQLLYLLGRMLTLQRRAAQRVWRLDCVRPATRFELYRRVARAADYIESNYEHPIGLQELAGVACLSRFHLLRLFRAIYGVTPQSYKEQKRVRVARRLLATRQLSVSEVAARVGYSTRTSLRTQLKCWGTELESAPSL